MTRPPNILFLMADQLAPHFLPAYGLRVVKTPRLDEIAADSAIFGVRGLRLVFSRRQHAVESVDPHVHEQPRGKDPRDGKVK